MNLLPCWKRSARFALALLAAASVPAVRASSSPSPAWETVATVGAIGIAQEEPADTVAGVEVRLPLAWHGIRPWLGSSVVDNGTWFAGAGFIRDFAPAPRWVVTLGTGPFYYRSAHRNLGLDLEFYSFGEITRRLPRDMRVGLRVGHLSNGGLGRRNPGTENVLLVAVIPLGRNRAMPVEESAFSRSGL